MMGGGMFFGWIFLIAIIVLAVWLIKSLSTGSHGTSSTSPPPASEAKRTPIQILEERFARGEIDKQEFEERKKELPKAG